jgi:hypothetical protein
VLIATNYNNSHIPYIPKSFGQGLKDLDYKVSDKRSKELQYEGKSKIYFFPKIDSSGLILPEYSFSYRATASCYIESICLTIRKRILSHLSKHRPEKTPNLTDYHFRMLDAAVITYVFSGNFQIINRFISCLYTGRTKGFFPIVRSGFAKLDYTTGFLASFSLRGNRLLPYCKIRDNQTPRSVSEKRRLCEVLETKLSDCEHFIDTRVSNIMFNNLLFNNEVNKLWFTNHLLKIPADKMQVYPWGNLLESC